MRQETPLSTYMIIKHNIKEYIRQKIIVINTCILVIIFIPILVIGNILHLKF